MAMEFMKAIENRRSIYGFTGNQPVSYEKIEEIVREAIKNTPSAYNSQSTRIIILFGDNHKKLWEFTLAQLEKVTPPDKFGGTAEKVNGSFASGYATILFFEDKAVIDGLVDAFPLYADNFRLWSQHTNAMHQLVVWTALEAEGLGATLQHYNPLIDADVQKEWNVPETWQLIAQMPVGEPSYSPDAKEISDVDARVKIFR